ncbi:acyl carrier protein [Streptomyces sp. NPDC056149]|uniref:acyl carrier protein n=1 Tax=unclassified Streptomyces TaxID=2593676 RepID=UPI002380FBA1|nr:acyl carrier protein [Streptomyces sp. WZ-12]
MYDILTCILTDKFKVKPELIRPDASMRTLGLDSLFMLELSLILKKNHGIDVELDDLLAAGTLEELMQAAERKRHASS